MHDHPETIQVGGATLILGDVLARLREIPSGSVDLVLADPPYCSGATREAGRTAANKTMTRSTRGQRDRWFGSDSLSTRGFVFLLRECALEWQRILKPGGHALVFIDWRMDDVAGDAIEAKYQRRKAEMGDAIESVDLRRAGLLVWDKTYFGLGKHFRLQHELVMHFTKGAGTPPLRRDVGNVIACPPVRFGRHPCEKPERLLGTLIETLCPEGGTVLDPFFGSCASGAAAMRRNRRFVGIERERTYFDLGWHRLVEIRDDVAAA